MLDLPRPAMLEYHSLTPELPCPSQPVCGCVWFVMLKSSDFKKAFCAEICPVVFDKISLFHVS